MHIKDRPARAVVIAIGIAGLVTAATGTGVALASARWNAIWSNGTIHQCLDNKTFVTRTLPRGKHCNSHESAFTFNQTGPRGPRGLTGTPGLGASVLSDDNSLSTFAPPNDSSWLREVVKETTITTSQPGKLLVLDATVESCSVNNPTNAPITDYHYGVYVDGVGVPGTYTFNAMSAPPGVVTEMAHPNDAPAVMVNVPAGTHTIDLDLITHGTTTNYMTGATGRLLVIATG